MLLPLKAIISKKNIRRDGTGLIQFQYCYSSENRTLLGTEIGVPVTYWNKKRQAISNSLPQEFGNAEFLNASLDRMKSVIEKLIQQATALKDEKPGQYVKDRFRPDMRPEDISDLSIIAPVLKKEPDFFDEIKDYIAVKETKVVSTAKFNQMRDYLKSYEEYSEKKITFENLDYNLYADFVEYLTYHYPQKRKKATVYGLKQNTIGKAIKNLRIFILDRVRRKRISPIDLGDFKIVEEESDAVYLTTEEIRKVYEADLSTHPQLVLYRDLFVLGCLSGLRFSDFTSLTYEDLRNGMVFKKTNKVDDWVVIPLRREAREIFERVFKNGTPRIPNAVFNEKIKEIAALAGITQLVKFSYKKGNKDIVTTKPKAQWVTSHTCRRSFASNEFLAGTDPMLIMKITGHKSFRDSCYI